MKVRYSASALADIDDILGYLSRHNRSAAATVGMTIEHTVVRLAEFPNSAQETDTTGIRMTPAGRYPFLIFYSVEPDEIHIIRILHGARRRPWQSE